MKRRFVAIWFPELLRELVEREHEEARTQPYVVILREANASGLLSSGQQSLGPLAPGQRVHAVGPIAAALGISSGDTLASACGRCAGLLALPFPLHAMTEALECLATSLLAEFPTVALLHPWRRHGQAMPLGEGGLWLDVTDCAALHGSEANAALLQELLEPWGHRFHWASAAGPMVAFVKARAAGLLGTGIPWEECPLELLSLEPERIDWLQKLGLRTIGALQQLPRGALTVRWGELGEALWELSQGRDEAQLVPFELPEQVAITEEGDEPLRELSALRFLLRGVVSRFVVQLRARGEGVLALELRWDYAATDEVFDDSEERPATATVQELNWRFPLPLWREEELYRIIDVRCQQLVLPAPVRSLTLRSCSLASVHHQQRSLGFQPEQSQQEHALTALVAELQGMGDGLQVGFWATKPAALPGAQQELQLQVPPRLPGRRRRVGAKGGQRAPGRIARYEGLGQILSRPCPLLGSRAFPDDGNASA